MSSPKAVVKEIEKINNSLQSKSIEQIESECDSFRNNATQNVSDLVKHLFFLETTKRFRENPRFKNSSFEDYLKNRHDMRHHTYQSIRLALHYHPKEVAAFGWPMVKAVRQSCGAENTKKVFKEIETSNTKRKTPLNQSEMNEIVKKYSQPKVSYVPIDYKAVENKYKKLQEEYNGLIKLLAEKDNRIEKLSKALKEYKAKFGKIKSFVLD